MADFSRLPGPNADLWDWQLLAACRGVDSSLFFHPEGSAALPAAHAKCRRKRCACAARYEHSAPRTPSPYASLTACGAG